MVNCFLWDGVKKGVRIAEPVCALARNDMAVLRRSVDLFCGCCGYVAGGMLFAEKVCIFTEIAAL